MGAVHGDAGTGGGKAARVPFWGWVEAVLGGVRDTARAMLDEARAGAREGYEEGWRRFERKTKRPRRGGSHGS